MFIDWAPFINAVTATVYRCVTFHDISRKRRSNETLPHEARYAPKQGVTKKLSFVAAATVRNSIESRKKGGKILSRFSAVGGRNNGGKISFVADGSKIGPAENSADLFPQFCGDISSILS